MKIPVFFHDLTKKTEKIAISSHNAPKKNMKISVLLAAFCGTCYIETQINSILNQISPEDELIVSDDSPPEQRETQALVEAMAVENNNIRYCIGPRRGVIANFEFLLSQASGEILVLSDQDDVWLPGKISIIRKNLERSGIFLLQHDAYLTDSALNYSKQTLFQERASRPGFFRNWFKNHYTGCCMAFTQFLLPYILPFPKNIPMHDQWIGLRAEQLQKKKICKILWIKEPLLLYRRHSDTQTGHGTTLFKKIVWRVHLAQIFLKKR